MSTSIAKLKDEINEVRYNPAAIQRRLFQTLEEMTQGEIDVVDPSNPFVFLMEASVVLTSAQMEESENLTRRLYPSMAQTEDELYLHMSDQDYVGRFNSPSRTTFKLLFHKDEIIKRAVLTEDGETRKIVIPRNTEFQVSDYTFTMEYPVELRVLGHGGLQVAYDVTQPSPLQTLESNMVDWSVVILRGEDYVLVNLPINQFELKPRYAHLNRSTQYNKSFALDDPFYYCRVYRATSGGWEEIRTTHTDQVFDPNVPTALLKVYEDSLNVSIPHIYISNRSLDKELRVDIYTTKGPLNLILDGYEMNAFTANWRDVGKKDSKFSAPLNVFTSMAVYSDDIVTGGAEGLDFETLRERVMTNALGNAQLPITEAQLNARLANMGYLAVKDVDNVTNRIYLASRHLPQPQSERTVSGASCTVGRMQGIYDELVNYQGVWDNKERITITSDCLFSHDNGVTRFVPNTQRQHLKQLTGSGLTTAINQGTYLTTPFHYVLDAEENQFYSRAYYLDGPTIENREYVEENTTMGLSVDTNSLHVHKKEDRYTLQVNVHTGKQMIDVDTDDFVTQLSFRPPNERQDVYLNGRCIKRNGQTWVFEFDLLTRFDVNGDHRILLDGFTMYPSEIRYYEAELTTTFNLVHYAKKSLVPGEVRSLLYPGALFLFKDDYRGVSHEKLDIRFGDYLEGFWENSRTVVSSSSYITHDGDVEATYESNVYKRDPITGTIELKMDDNGQVSYDVLHREGETILNDEGDPVLLYRKGDPVLDSNGEPILSYGRGLLREWDIFLIDGRYRFATRQQDTDYLKEIPRTIISWLKTDLYTFRQWALEQTEIFLYPQRTLGGAEALVGEGENRVVDLEQSFKVTYYLTHSKYSDTFVRETLGDLAKDVIADTLRKGQLKHNQMVAKITARAGEDIIAVEVEGLGGKDNLSALTLINDVERCAIRKRLEQTLDGEFEVVDDVNVNFIRHSES